jgi:transposase-like protein
MSRIQDTEKKEKVRCTLCNSLKVVKKGFRQNKKSKIQMYKCNDCDRGFNLRELDNKSYNVNIILAALSYYNLGHTFASVSLMINKRFKVKTSAQLIHNWFKENKELCSFSRFRNKNEFGKDTVVSKMFDHKQPYLFKYHKFKIDHLLNDYFSGLKGYLVDVIDSCPDEMFVASNLRSSQFKLDALMISKVKIIKSKNHACNLASLALKSCKSNRERHSVVQDFMLVNDSVTLGVEVPIWLKKEEIMRDEVLKGVLGVESCVTGHIDIVQSKFGFIHVVDYKPMANRENLSKVVSQLFVYSVALSVRTGIWLRNIRCGWFDSGSYFEFNPNYIVIDYLKKNGITSHDVWKKYWSDFVKHEKAVNMRFK